MKSGTFTVLKSPSEQDVSKLLAQAGSAGLRGIEDYGGNVFLWPYNDGTHMMVASMLGIPYDSAKDYVDKLTGKTFYIRNLDDWLSASAAELNWTASPAGHGTHNRLNKVRRLRTWAIQQL